MGVHTHAKQASAVEAAPLRRPRSPRAARSGWERNYVLVLLGQDTLLLAIAATVALRVRFGGDPPGSVMLGNGEQLSYGLVTVLAVGLWVLLIALSRGYEARFLGTGSAEFTRIINATVRMAALVGTTAFLAQADLSRGFVAVVLPLGLGLLLVGRYATRKVLHALRRAGRAQHRCVVVGTASEAQALAREIEREAFAGMQVVGVCLPDFETGPVLVGGVPLPELGPARTVGAVLAGIGADTVAVAGGGALSSRELRELAWQIEGQGIDLALAPGLTDVAGPRVHIRPVAGLPLLHVEEPSYGGLARLVKYGSDRVLALSLLGVLAPLLLVIAVLIRREDSGPVLYRQERVGRAGKTFRIYKFRSMTVGADQVREELVSQAAGPLFKVRADPRLTRIGARIRRHSLDELPQLLNVAAGSMSLVGPRPPLRGEVDLYDQHVHRRLLVKPGMTGLWQVSGRSDLDWEEAVRLDLYYVENWSVAFDLMILWKTLFAVIRGRGAY